MKKGMKNICVLIRVYDRIDDLAYNLKIIRDTWVQNSYSIVVVFNGQQCGYKLPPIINVLADNILILGENAGHLKGNSQLLLEGLKHIQLSVFDYVIILEADTWLYTDQLISKYVGKLEASDAVWASARWYDRFYSLATDFAIIKSSYLKTNSAIFDFATYPECYVCNYLLNHGQKYIWIHENMNVQLPSYIRKFPFAPMGRFYAFPASKMVTHHIEQLKYGMRTKKRHFNIAAKCNYFVDESHSMIYLYIMNLYMQFSHLIDRCFLRRSWYSKRKVLNL